MFKHGLLFFLLCTNTLAQTLQIDKGIVTRNDTLKGKVLLSSPLSGGGQLTLTWTDSYGRTVALLSSNVTSRGNVLPFQLPLKPAVSLLNYLEAELTRGKNVVKAPRVEFIVTPDEPWDDYQVIMYYPYNLVLRPDKFKTWRAGILTAPPSGGSTTIASIATRWHTNFLLHTIPRQSLGKNG